MKLPNKKFSSGFTLIELLLVIAIITVLAVAVYVALNPAKRLEEGKDSRRATDVDSILSAVHQSVVDNKGTYPTNMPAAGAEKQLGTGDVTQCPAISNGDCSTTAGCVDLMSGAQNLATFLKTMPSDPGSSDTPPQATGYAVVRDANGIVTVKACYTDGTTTVSASR